MIELETGFDCRICSQKHATLPLSFCCKAPLAVTAIPAWQMDHRVLITSEQCVIDETHFYLRGRVVVPIRGCDQPFVWGVWAQVSAKDFYRAYKRWNTAGRELDPPFSGKLANDLSRFGNPAGLALEVHTQPVGRRPSFVVHSDRYPLGKEQRYGISRARAEELAAILLHPATEPATQIPANAFA